MKGIASAAKNASVSFPRPNEARITASSIRPVSTPTDRHTETMLVFLIRYLFSDSRVSGGIRQISVCRNSPRRRAIGAATESRDRGRTGKRRPEQRGRSQSRRTARGGERLGKAVGGKGYEPDTPAASIAPATRPRGWPASHS